jgi:hypothetical protein
MIKNTEHHNPIQLLQAGDRITIKRSKREYFGKLIIAICMVCWGASSIAYLIDKPMVSDLLSRFFGQWLLQKGDLLPEIIFGFGLFVNLSLPLIIRVLFYSVELTISQFDVEYKSRGRTQKIFWDQIVKIKASTSKETIELTTNGGIIRIESVFNLSTDQLIDLLCICWAYFASGEQFTQRAEQQNDAGETFDSTEMRSILIHFRNEILKFEKRLVIFSYRALIVVTIVIIPLTLVVLIFSIWFLQRLPPTN